MKVLLVVSVVLLAFGGIASAGTKSKCQVVGALRNQGVPDSEIRDWLCLVKHESNYQYDATNLNSGGSTDYGIYQINDGYWCNENTIKYSECWQIHTYGCGVKCSSLINSDISDDTECAVKIKKCGGFSPWYAWRNYCRGKNLAGDSNYDFDHCSVF